MYQIDLRSRQPIYEQLIEKLKQLIISKALIPDEQLPSVRALAKDIPANPNTVLKAYQELERQGYIYSHQGKGYFVSPESSIQNDLNLNKIKHLVVEVKKMLMEARYLGLTHSQALNIIDETYKDLKT